MGRGLAWALILLLTAAEVSAQPYLQRGDEVTRRYEAYRQRLERFFEVLRARVEIDAPVLKLNLVPPAPVPYGYQILPKLIPDLPRRARRSRLLLTTFSWSRTESRIDRDDAKVSTLEGQLGDAAGVAGEEQRRLLDKLVEEYKSLVASQKVIAAWIQYNRLWQGEIVRHPGIYRDLTALQEAALQRQALLDALPVGDERIDADLRDRADALARTVEEAVRKVPTPDFVRIDRSAPRRWVLEVPLYTDIADTAFVERFRTTVESAWQVRDGGDEFSVVLDIRRMSAKELYPDGSAPAPGAHINVSTHLQRFPAGGVVLTTGGTTINATGWRIVLGPHAIGPSALIHEFGHMLGFKDGYFRGYRDRGADGYEVLEVILDPEDIVATPDDGRVRRQHFDQILDERRR